MLSVIIEWVFRDTRFFRGKFEVRMGYLYAAIWIVAGVILMTRLRKENRVFLIAGIFFEVLGLWWLGATAFPAWDLFNGVPGLVIRVLTAAVLVICAAVFWRENRKNTEKAKKGD